MQQISSHRGKCLEDSDCEQALELCNLQTLRCDHKNMFPMQQIEFYGTYTCMIAIMIANAGGLPSGGIVIPIALFFWKFDLHESITLSNITIIASIFIQTIFTLRSKQQHQLSQTSSSNQFDNNLATVSIGPAIIGSFIGTMVCFKIPEFLLFIIHVLLLAIVIGIQIHSTSILFKQEKQRIRYQEVEMQKNVLNSSREQQQLMMTASQQNQFFQLTNFERLSIPIGVYKDSQVSSAQQTPHQQVNRASSYLTLNSNRQQLLFKQGSHPNLLALVESGDANQQAQSSHEIIIVEKPRPMMSSLPKFSLDIKFSMHLLSLFTLIAFLVLKEMFVEKCTRLDLLAFGIVIAIMTMQSITSYLLVKRDYFKQQQIGHRYENDDFQPTNKRILQICGLMLLCGLLSGLTGMTQLLLVKLLLEKLKINQQVTYATSIYITLFTTASSLSLQIIFDFIYLDFLLMIIILTILGTIPGLIIKRYVMKETRRYSYVDVILIICLIACFASIMTYEIYNTVVNGIQSKRLIFQRQYCD